MPSPLRPQTITRIRSNLQIPVTSNLITDSDLKTIIQENLEGAFTQNAPRTISEARRGENKVKMPLPSEFDIELSVISEIFVRLPQTKDVIDKAIYAPQLVDDSEYAIQSAPLAGVTSLTFAVFGDAFFFKPGDLISISDDNASETNWIQSSDESTGIVTLHKATANAYTATPTIALQNYLDFSGWPLGLGRVFGANEVYNVEYNTAHVHDDSQSTIAKKDYNAFVALCKAGTCYAMASKFSQKTISSFRADAVDHSGLSGEWERRGDKFRKTFEDHFGITDANRVSGGAAIKHIHFARTWGMPINLPFRR